MLQMFWLHRDMETPRSGKLTSTVYFIFLSETLLWNFRRTVTMALAFICMSCWKRICSAATAATTRCHSLPTGHNITLASKVNTVWLAEYNAHSTATQRAHSLAGISGAQ